MTDERKSILVMKVKGQWRHHGEFPESLNWGQAELVCWFQMFKLCLESGEETLNIVQGDIMKNVERYDCKSGRCGRKGLEGGRQEVIAEGIGP